MSEWKEYRLKTLGNVTTGKTPSKDHPEDWGNEMPFVTPTDYKTYLKYASSSARNLSKSGINKLIKKVLPPKSILVTCIGSDMGKVVMNKTAVITNQQINSIIPNADIADGDFLYYVLIDMYDILRTYGGDGTAVPIVNKGDFENLQTNLPDLPEQKAIASVLSSLDDKIDLLHRQNKTLEAMAESLFRQWFVEEAQDDWEEKRLADFVEHIKAGVTPASNPMQAYTHYSLPAFDGGMRPGVELGGAILSNKYSVVPWSILVSKLNPRFPRIWPIGEEPGENAICSTEFQVFKPINKNLYGYLYYLLKSKNAREELSMAASGTSGSHQRVRPEDILNIGSNLPSMALAKQYSELVEPGINKLLANLGQIQSLEKLRDTLLPKLISGEVRVDYEKQIQ